VLFFGCVPTTTSSFRIDVELMNRLQLAAKRTNHNKNWIINQALNEYLSRRDQADLKREATRQSREARLALRPKAIREAEAWERAANEVWNAG
jgi:predicted DNA-binding protein